MTRKAGSSPMLTASKAAAKYRRNDLDDLSGLVTHSETDLHLAQLLALHPALKVRFRSQDLATLDDATKRTLLDDCNRVLGIKPLRKRIS